MAGSTPSASHYHTKTVNGPQIEKNLFYSSTDYKATTMNDLNIFFHRRYGDSFTTRNHC